jgi:hypothetical protein
MHVGNSNFMLLGFLDLSGVPLTYIDVHWFVHVHNGYSDIHPGHVRYYITSNKVSNLNTTNLIKGRLNIEKIALSFLYIQCIYYTMH